MGSKRKLKKRIKKLEKIVQKSAIILTDEDNPNVSVVISLKNNGIFSVDKVVTTPGVSTSEIDNITSNTNQ